MKTSKKVENTAYALLLVLCIVNTYLLFNPFYIFVKPPLTEFLFERFFLYIANIFAFIILFHGERYEDRQTFWFILFAVMGIYVSLLMVGWTDMYRIGHSFIPLGLWGESMRSWTFGLAGCMLLGLLRMYELDLKGIEEAKHE